MNYAYLQPLGWSAHFEDQMPTHNTETFLPARIVQEERELYKLQLRPDLIIDGEVSGKMRFDASMRRDFPAVGDWVLCSLHSNNTAAVIHKILERKSCLARKIVGNKWDEQIIAANIDTVFIVTSMNSDFNLRRIERYLTLVWDSGARPVIVLSKSDLTEQHNEFLESVETIAAGVDTITLSSVDHSGFDKITKYFGEGQTCALVGSSGVGKSTIVNRLFQHEVLKVQTIRKDDDKGRHTTTSRHLFVLPQGGIIIDTPGMREIQLLDNDEGLESSFADVEGLITQCRFGDCQHESEPGCAVKSALSTGELSEERYESYLKLLREINFARRKVDKAFASAERDRWKKIYKAVRSKK